jgi:hypothetical protein
MRYIPHIPQTISELLDKLADMLFTAPSFKDKSGFFAEKNIDTAFFSLNEGLLVMRKKLGEERYATLRALSDKMRALFEADPEEKTGGTLAGCESSTKWRTS